MCGRGTHRGGKLAKNESRIIESLRGNTYKAHSPSVKTAGENLRGMLQECSTGVDYAATALWRPPVSPKAKKQESQPASSQSASQQVRLQADRQQYLVLSFFLQMSSLRFAGAFKERSACKQRLLDRCGDGDGDGGERCTRNKCLHLVCLHLCLLAAERKVTSERNNKGNDTHRREKNRVKK